MSPPLRATILKFAMFLGLGLLFPRGCIAQACNLICNSDFENVQVSSPGTYHLEPEHNVPCWNTTEPDSLIEVWGTGFNGVPAYSGNQFLELNANYVSTLYQYFTAIPNSTVNISFAHRGRLGPDVMSVSIGPVGGPYDTLGSFTADNTAWIYSTVTYTFPTGLGTNFTLQFNSISATGGNQAVGNFLDAISITLPTPAVTLSSTNTCSNDSAGLIIASVTGGTAPYNYTWNPSETGADTINNLAAGKYNLTVSDAYGCTALDSSTITALPTSSSTANPVICANSNYTLPDGTTVDTTGTYITKIPAANGCDSIITTNLLVNPAPVIQIAAVICYGTHYTLPTGMQVNTGGVYTDTLTTVKGCDSIIITTLTVNPPPVTPVAVSICYGSNYTLPNGVVTNQAGVYTDTLTAAGGCDSVVTTTLSITPPPVSAQFDTICAGQIFTRPNGLTASATGVYTDTLIAAGSCDSVVITHLTVNPVSASTAYDTICIGSSFTLQNGNTVNIAGSYAVTLRNSFGCDSIVTNMLTVIDLNSTAQASSVLCHGESTGTVTALGSDGVSPYTYQLSLNGIVSGSNTTGAFNSLAAGNYAVSVTDNFGCSATTTATINQPHVFSVTDSVANVTCHGLHDGSVTINAFGGTPGYSYLLGNEINTSGVFSQLDTGSYQYLVIDSAGCHDSAIAVITQPAMLLISLQPDSPVIYLGKSLQLGATSNFDPNAAYLWNPPTGLSCYTCANPQVSINATTVYSVMATANINGNNCTADTEITVTVIPDYDIFIPNAFTPDGDGNNDYFQLFGNLQAIKFMAIQIFDRQGERVFESNDVNFKWDGAYKGKPLPPQVLVYTLKAVFLDDHTDKLFRGSLTVVR